MRTREERRRGLEGVRKEEAKPVMRTMMPPSLLLLAGCLIVLTSLPITSTDAKQSDVRYPARNTNLMHETDLEENVYTFDKLWSVFYQDVTRWMAILEDVIAETIRTHFFNGLVDRKTIKRGLRVFAQNAFISLQQQGYFAESSRRLVSSLPSLPQLD